MELCQFSIRQNCFKMSDVFRTNETSTQIESVLYMRESHRPREYEVNLVCLELLLWNAEYVQPS